jgi:hypothetical protein
MLNASTRKRFRAFLDPRPVRWRTVVILAVLMAYADGFWLTSVEGAVGAIERSQSPFTSWLRDSTLMLPLFVLAVLVGLAVARRRFGPTLSSTKHVVAAGLLIVGACTLVAFGVVVVSALYDYQLQAAQLQFIQSTHPHGSLDIQLAATREADNAGARLATGADIITNLVLVGWVMALQGGRLASPRRTHHAVPTGA